MTEANVKEKAKSLDPARELIEKAEEQGYLTVEDVLELFPEAEKNLPQLEDLLMYLYNEGIEIISEEEESKEQQAEAKEQESEAEVEIEEEIFDLSGISSDDSISLYLKEMASVPLLKSDWPNSWNAGRLRNENWRGMDTVRPSARPACAR
jgi:RNA polymerase primary sigma factor